MPPARRVATGGPATLDWLGCATFRLRTAGLTIYLDAYLDRVPSAPSTGFGTADVDACDWLLIGHSHFDHLWGAETIAVRTGAMVVGSYETARVLLSLGVPERQIIRVAGGERLRLSADVTVRVFPSLHSCVWTHTVAPGLEEVCIGDLGVDYGEQSARSAAFIEFVHTLGPEVLSHLKSADQGAHGDGGALVYLIESPEGSVLFQDTAGSWTGVLASIPRPDVAILAGGGRGNLDGEPVQGSLVDLLVRETELLQPQSVILCHHDDWLPGLTTPMDETPLRAALESSASKAELVTLPYQSAYALFAGEGHL